MFAYTCCCLLLVACCECSHKERCERCCSCYYRQYNTLDTVRISREHFTGRLCDWCGGRLRDTIVHFSENLHQVDMNNALYHARQSDLSLVLGYDGDRRRVFRARVLFVDRLYNLWIVALCVARA
jgi:hypothetical protein